MARINPSFNYSKTFINCHMFYKDFAEDIMREIRRVERDGQVWFMAADVCNEVGITNCTVAVRTISAEHKQKIPFGGKGMVEKQFLNEDGVHELLRRTKKPGGGCIR